MGTVAVAHSIRRRALGAFLQQRRTRLGWRAVLLLVPAPLDRPRRRDHRRRLSPRALSGARHMINWTALIIFIILFGLVTFLGFIAAHWRKGDLDLLHEWGLGGRRFGTIVTWFLIGGDLYTAYTFVAVPALLFGAGAIGFFAVPYTIMVYPILYIVFPRLWSVAHRHGYITSADFVRGRFGNRWLALAVAFTGILATMPYIALQLVGIQVVLGAMGIETSGVS